MFQELILVKCCWRLRWWSLEIGRKSITRFSTLPWIASAVLGLTNEVNLLDARTWSLSVYFQTSGNTLGTSKEPSYKLFCFIWRFVWSLERILLVINCSVSFEGLFGVWRGYYWQFLRHPWNTWNPWTRIIFGICHLEWLGPTSQVYLPGHDAISGLGPKSFSQGLECCDMKS